MTVYRPRTSPQPGTPSSPAINCLLPYYSENLPGAPQRSCPHTKAPVYCDYPSSRQVSVHLHSVLESVFENLSGHRLECCLQRSLGALSTNYYVIVYSQGSYSDLTEMKPNKHILGVGTSRASLSCMCVCAHVETRCQSQV